MTILLRCSHAEVPVRLPGGVAVAQVSCGQMAGGPPKSRRPAEGFFTEQWKEFIVGKYGFRPTVAYYECPVVVDNRFGEVIRADQAQGEAV